MAENEDQKVVTAQVFRLENKAGEICAELKLRSSGYPVLVLYNKAHKARIIIGLNEDESKEIASVALCDENEEPQAGMLVLGDGEQEFFGFAEMVQRNQARARDELEKK